MIDVKPIQLNRETFLAISVELPKTTLLVVTNDIGYIMCGALDVDLLNEKLSSRKIVAGRATGVKTIDELLNAPLQLITKEAENYGITVGMTGKNALLKMK